VPRADNPAIFTCLWFTRALLADPFWFRKITTDPQILADVDRECPGDREAKLEIYISEVRLCLKICFFFQTDRNMPHNKL